MGNRHLSFRHNIFNESGYVVMIPSVDDGDLLHEHIPDPLTQTENPEFPLGSKLINGERVWRYCHNSAAAITVVGNILQGPAAVHADIEDDIATAASSGEPYAIGSHDITLTNTANTDAAPWTTADACKDGYIYVNLGTGIGQVRKIKSHEAATDQAAMKVTVYEGWTVAPVAGSTVCGLVQNPYSNVVVAAASQTAPPVGVATIAISANYYFWAQSGGPCAVTCHAAIIHGRPCVVGTAAGEIDPWTAYATEFTVGWTMTPGTADNDAALIFLTIDR